MVARGQTGGRRPPDRGRRSRLRHRSDGTWMQPVDSNAFRARVDRAPGSHLVGEREEGRPSSNRERRLIGLELRDPFSKQSTGQSHPRDSTQVAASGLAPVREAMEQDRAIRVSGRDQHGIGDPERIVLRPRAEKVHLLTSRGQGHLHLRIAATGSMWHPEQFSRADMSGTAFEILARIGGVDQSVEVLGRLRQCAGEEAKSGPSPVAD